MSKIQALNRISSGPIRCCLNKFNPEKAGFVLKDGTIQFKNQETAIEYGIHRCCAALQGTKPFERAVNIKGSRVIQEIQGAETEIRAHNFTEIMVHGHPDFDFYPKGVTNAVSLDDYECFIDRDCMKKIYAVNSKGEYYKLEKIPGFDFSKIDVGKTFGDFNIKFKQSLYGGKDAPPEYQRIVKECFQKLDWHYYMDKLVHICMRYDESSPPRYVINGLHEFWVKFGKLFGVTAETNFSHFKNL